MASITPLQYADKYWNLDVPIVDDATEKVKEWITVRVDTYRLGANETAAEELMGKVRPRLDQMVGGKKADESLTVYVKTTDGALDQKVYKDRFALAGVAKRPFSGKGCPECVQVTLQLALRLGVIKPAAGAVKQALQDYCDSVRIGLDCNGFIGSYIRNGLQKVSWQINPAEKSSEIDGNSLINSIMSAGEPITSTAQIVQAPQRSYVLAEVDPGTGRILDHGDPSSGHIMISQPGTATYKPWKVWAGGFGGVNYNNVLAFQVVESTAKAGMISELQRSGEEGLVQSWYRILEEDARPRFTVFKIQRGSKVGSIYELMYVRIAAVKGT
jgi:hypothetical protein